VRLFNGRGKLNVWYRTFCSTSAERAPRGKTLLKIARAGSLVASPANTTPARIQSVPGRRDPHKATYHCQFVAEDQPV